MTETTFHKFGPRISAVSRGADHPRVSLGAFTAVEDGVRLDPGASSKSFIRIGVRCKLKEGCILKTYDGSITIGDRVTVGEYSIIAGHGGVVIGSASALAGHCYVSAQNHIFTGSAEVRFQGETAKGIHIGRNVWIGGGVKILDGVEVGDESVVGAGSIVTHNIPSKAVAYGVPCRVQRDTKPRLMRPVVERPRPTSL